jgi:hypothetical protein
LPWAEEEDIRFLPEEEAAGAISVVFEPGKRGVCDCSPLRMSGFGYSISVSKRLIGSGG